MRPGKKGKHQLVTMHPLLFARNKEEGKSAGTRYADDGLGIIDHPSSCAAGRIMIHFQQYPTVGIGD